jgi:protein phosphatase
MSIAVEELADLLARVRERAPGLVVSLSGRYTVVGDLHGDYRTLRQVLNDFESPYLFLGDYVDRGDMGLEVVEEVFRLFVEGRAVALRGNHESPIMNVDGGFLDELCEKVGSKCGEVYAEFERTFARLPLAAVINQEAVALHGGIPLRAGMSPATLEDVKSVSGDLTIPADPIAFQVLWNDPCEECADYAPSPRGPGAWLFGASVTAAFHRAGGTSVLIRGHTYTPRGCAISHGGTVITVFSSAAPPYRETRPKIAVVGRGIEVFDVYAKRPVSRAEMKPLWL